LKETNGDVKMEQRGHEQRLPSAGMGVEVTVPFTHGAIGQLGYSKLLKAKVGLVRIAELIVLVIF
jgi:hypothetical protein